MPSIRCARCGYENHLHQRFCGMCGNGLASSAPTQVTTPVTAATPHREEPSTPRVVEEEKPISFGGGGPSFLGLDEPSRNTDYLFDEPSRHGARGIVFLLALILAFACGIWLVRREEPGWLSQQYAQVKSSIETILGSKPESQPAPASTTSQTTPTPTVNTPPQETQSAKQEAQASATENSRATDIAPAANAGNQSDQPANSATKPAATQAAAIEKIPNNPASSGVADVEEGEKYLYGRGVRQDCRRAQSNLMNAADVSNAKAQGILGTMYATGHCAPRDLATAYHWFLEARKADPKNFRYEQDLQLIWRQMTNEQKQQVEALRP